MKIYFQILQTFANNWHWIRHTSTMIMVGHHLSPARDVYKNNAVSFSSLKRLHLDFWNCSLSSKSGVSIGKMFRKLTKVEDLVVYLNNN